MRWPWNNKPPRLRIPSYEPAPVVVHEMRSPKRKDDGLVVEEHDTSAMTQTGVFKAWKRLTGG